MHSSSRIVLAALLLTTSAIAQRGALFDDVATTLEEHYYDEAFREEFLPTLIERHRAEAHRSRSLHEERTITQAFLSNLPVSHLGLLSATSYRALMDDLMNEERETFGFELKCIDGKYYAHPVLEGGPAERAGLVSWDRIRRIDGLSPEDSDRLDWRSDDAFLPDPPVHRLRLLDRPVIRLEVERRPGEIFSLAVKAEPYSAWRATTASRRIHESERVRIGYVHFWYVHVHGMPSFLAETLESAFAGCDAVIVDLRGRGGNGSITSELVDVLERDGRPIVALIDRGTRSAKEIWALKLRERGVARLVGERTAGAVIPATFEEVGYDSVLMFPSFELPRHTHRLEGRGVAPHVLAESPGPHAAGSDPILERGLLEAHRAATGREP